MILSYTTSSPIDNPHAVAADFGIGIKRIPVKLNIIELDVVAITTNVSNDFNIVVSVLYFLYFFLDLLFLSLKYIINFLILLIELLKLFISFNFFPYLCSESLFFNGADGYILFVFCSI